MDIPEVESMNILKKHDHPSNHQLGEEGMNTVGIHIVEVEDMNMMEEWPSNHQPEDEGMNMVEEHRSKEWSEMDGMNMEDIDMVKDMMMNVEVVEREYEGMVLASHWICDGAERHRWTHRKWKEFTKSECSEGHITFASPNSNYSTLCRVEKSEEESENVMKYVWNELKSWGQNLNFLWFFWIFEL
jgi:hypothetical protein